jgi:hypothetical protein
LNALANDTLSNIAATTTNTNVTPLTTGPLSIDANGIVTVAANTPSGTYSIIYQLCSQSINRIECAQQIVIPLPPQPGKQSNRCSERSIGNCCIKQYGSNGIERITNDTLSNIAATTTNTNVTPLTTGPLSIDANGIVTVAANTPSGTYSITTNYAKPIHQQD